MDYYGSISEAAASAAVSDLIAGGQLLAQAITAVKALQPGKSVKSVHAVFARAGRVSLPLELRTQTVQDGRTMGTVVVTFVQEDRPFATATVLTHVPDPDLIRHAASMPDVSPPGEPSGATARGPFELLPTDDEPLGRVPATQRVWLRFPGAASDEATGQALLAFATNFFLVEVAMKPHAGLSVDQSHLQVSTGVLSHSVSFHEPFDASQWLLVDLEAPYAGRGRFFGTGSVFTGDGALVASLTQEGMIRGLGASRGQGATL